MLSTLVKQQRHWTIPLMVSLAFSWCLMLCSGLTNEAYAADTPPPCHSQVVADTGHEMAAPAMLDSEHDNCAGCDNQATQLDPLSLPAVILRGSWQPATDIWPVKEPTERFLALAAPPRPSVPLYLRKNLLLI